MDFEDFRKQRDDTFMSEHELSDDQLKKLIEEKMIRAREYRQAFRIREDEIEL